MLRRVVLAAGLFLILAAIYTLTRRELLATTANHRHPDVKCDPIVNTVVEHVVVAISNNETKVDPPPFAIDMSDVTSPLGVTTEYCHINGDKSEFCVYENFCFDGDQLVFIHPDNYRPPPEYEIADLMRDGDRHFAQYFEQSASLEDRLWRPELSHGVENDIGEHDFENRRHMPRTSRFLYRIMTVSEVNRLPFFRGPHNDSSPPGLYMLDGGLWGADVGPLAQQNPWHCATQVMPLWTARRNSAGRFGSRYNMTFELQGQVRTPSMDYVFLGHLRPFPANPRDHEYCDVMIQLASHPKSKFIFHQWSKISGGERLLCARRGVWTGISWNVFASRADAYMFRQHAYTTFNIPASPMRYTPQGKVLIITRLGSRFIGNIDQVIAMVNDSGVPWELVNLRMPVAEQIATFANARIVIGAHGAAHASVMFMPAHSVLIEMFPFRMRTVGIFQQMSFYAQVLYLPVFTHVKASGTPDDKWMSREWNETCEAPKARRPKDAPYVCGAWGKHAPLVAPMDELRAAYTTALIYVDERD